MLSTKILHSIPIAIWTLRRLSVDAMSDEITFQQFRILNQVYEGMGQSQISQNLQVSGPAVSKMVEALVVKKMLIRKQGKDRRCLNLLLTQKGMKIRMLVVEQVEKVLDDKFKKLTPSEKSDLNKGLDVLDKLIGLINEE
jgi:DNA-binding MarR family transcriptional regulator